MKKHIYLLLQSLLLLTFYTGFTQSTAPGIIWQKTIGGSSSDVLTAMCVKADKSIVLCGYSNSDVSGNKSNSSMGGYDYWVVKLDGSGNVIWNKTFGGGNNDLAAAVINTSDGGYLVGGSSISNKTGSKSSISFGKSYDYWVLKLDVNGNIQWDKTMGGTYTDKLTSLAELPNGKFLVGGYAYSSKTGSKTLDNLGTESNADYWTIVLNTDGSENSQRIFGGGSHDVLTCVSPAGTSGYYAAGYSYSSKRAGAKSKNGYGNNDYYLVRYNLSTKKTEYQNDFGGKLSDYLTCMQAFPDNSFIIGGYSNSYKSNSKKDDFYGVTDFWLVKIRSDGSKQWDKTIAGAAGGDYLMSVQQTKDKGFILGGYSNSNAGHNKTENSKGGYDYWIVKTDSSGNIQWDKTIGGNGDDKLTAIYEVADNEYIVAGTSGSSQSGNKSTGIIGGSSTDYWVMHLGPTSSTGKLSDVPGKNIDYSKYKLEIMPNPVKDVLNIRYVAPASNKVDFVIYTANGRTVLQSTLTSSNAVSTRSFNVAYLPAGSYFAIMYINGVKLTKAFTKE